MYWFRFSGVFYFPEHAYACCLWGADLHMLFARLVYIDGTYSLSLYGRSPFCGIILPG